MTSPGGRSASAVVIALMFAVLALMAAVPLRGAAGSKGETSLAPPPQHAFRQTQQDQLRVFLRRHLSASARPQAGRASSRTGSGAVVDDLAKEQRAVPDLVGVREAGIAHANRNLAVEVVAQSVVRV